MGSFTELTLAFTFCAETPRELLGAFADWRTGEGAPELPTLEESSGGDPFDADMYLGNYFGDDPMGSLSLLERAAIWSVGQEPFRSEGELRGDLSPFSPRQAPPLFAEC